MIFLIGTMIGGSVFLVFDATFHLLDARRELLRMINTKMNTREFGFTLNVSLICGVSATLIVGAFANELIVVSTIGGLVVGWLIARGQVAKQKRDEALHMSLSIAKLAEDCAILSTTHLGIRHSLTLALKSSSSEVQRRVTSALDGTEKDVLFVHQLKELSYKERDNSLGRFARTLAISLERGISPEVSLQQLAQEVRATARRDLLSLAAKKEIAMMFPVVFAVLPSVTAVALYPAMKSLQHI